MEEKDFYIILSKNRLARTVNTLYKEKGEQVPEHVYLDFSEIEEKTGTGNQPTAKEIFDADMDV